MQALLAKEKGIGKKLLAVLMAVALAVGVALPTGADKAWGGPMDDWDEGNDYDSGITNNAGTADHIEIKVSGTVTIVVDGITYTPAVTFTTGDSYSVSATYDADSDGVADPYTSFSWGDDTDGDGVFTGGTVVAGDGAQDGSSTLELSGDFPVGVDPEDSVIYTVSVVKDITIELKNKDGSFTGETLTIPVTLTETISYWDADNDCPGTYEDGERRSNWTDGKFCKGSGFDIPLSGEYIGQAITEGKLALEKVVSNDANDVSTEFEFALQDSTGAYCVFDENCAYTGTQAAPYYIVVKANQRVVLTDLPEGAYKITEIMKEGYTITDANGEASTNYTKDYTVEAKDDDSIPIVTFTNKELTNEAAISIKKVASGLTSGSYPNPKVSIYKYSEGVKGDQVWSGQLTANGDTLYLNVTLQAGTYIVEETNAELSGSVCTTSLSAENATSVSGMTFVVAAGARCDLTVSNVYNSTADVIISKIVAGNMGDRSNEFEFTAQLTRGLMTAGEYKDANGNLLYTVASDGVTITFNLAHGESVTMRGVPIGATLSVTEANEGYSVDVESTKLASSEISISTSKEGETITAVTAAATVVDGMDLIFTNTKDANIDTGVSLDSLPYLVILGGALLCGLVLAGRMALRRKED